MRFITIELVFISKKFYIIFIFLYLFAKKSIYVVMVHMTCRRTKTAKEDLAFVVKKFLCAKTLEKIVSRSPTDSHTQTVGSADQQTQVVIELLAYSSDVFFF